MVVRQTLKVFWGQNLSNVAEPWGHAGLTLIRKTRFSYLLLKGSLWGVWCLLISPALEGLNWILRSKKPLPETSGGLEQSSWVWRLLWRSSMGGLWLQQLSPLVPVLCSVLRAGASETARMWAETFISLSTWALLHPLPPGWVEFLKTTISSCLLKRGSGGIQTGRAAVSQSVRGQPGSEEGRKGICLVIPFYLVTF